MAGLDLNAAMDDLGTALATISGLRVFDYPPENLAPPTAIVAFPEAVVYDLVMGRGADRATFKVHVIVGDVDKKSSRDRIAPYVTGDGSSSVKAALQAYAGRWDTLRVDRADIGRIVLNGITYLAATFDVDVIR